MDEQTDVTLALKLFLQKLEERVPIEKIKFSFKDRKTIVFPAIHFNVGDMEVVDDGGEITIFLGNFTHVHFENYKKSLSELEKLQYLAKEAAEFVEDILADRMEFYGSHTKGGVCRPRANKSRNWLSKLWFGSKTYVWSGPLDK